MTDAIVETVLHLLTSFIESEISLIKSLPENLRAIKEELISISEFLKSAEERAIRDEATKVWVKHVRTLSYEIEDVIEEYQLLKKKNALGKLINPWHNRSDMARTIKSMRERAAYIGTMRDSYNPSRLSNNVAVEQGNTSCCIFPEPPDNLVGVDISRNEIVELLDQKKLNEGPSIVAIVGMSGLGKTSIVRCIYNELITKTNRFSKHAWISMSQTRGQVDILRSMLHHFYEIDDVNKRRKRFFKKLLHFNNPAITSLDRSTLQDLVIKYLKKKRCLIVFDDVQDRDMQMVTYIKQVLSTTNRDNKILVTTCYENVARAWTNNFCKGLYRLKPLTYEEAWKLFSNRTFQSLKGTCPQWLEDLAQGIVRKCDGLPLAILAMGGLLSTRLNDMDEWKKISESLGFFLERNHHLTGIHEILIRNYYDLPCYLKPCFLYFGIFPKDYPIERMRLIRLWIAEGFIEKHRGNLTLEEVAEENLNELINKSLVNEVRDPTERTKALRVHEFLHEIILSKLHELSFCQILSGKCCNGGENPRRLSIRKDHKLEDAYEPLNSNTKGKSKVRCLFTYELKDDMLAERLTTKVLHNVPLLKVLDLRGAPISSFPEVVCNLLNLQYLSLRNTRVRSLPSSIGNLQDLQTLDLKQTLICELPTEIKRLHKLRHLLTYSYESGFDYSPHIQKVRGTNIPQGTLENFGELQKLAFVNLSDETKVVKELRNLRRLGIVGLKLKGGKDLCTAIEEMKYLQALSVYSTEKSEMIDLEHFQSPPKTLKRLYLNGPLKSFPRWIFDLHNLVKIRLRWSNLHDSSPFQNLSALPNLVELQLLEAFSGESLEIAPGGFEKLKILNLLDLHGLKCLSIKSGALPLLEELSIGESPQLQLPSGIKYLHRLKTLNFFNMPRDFTDCIHLGKHYHSIVQHVPEVFFRYKCNEGYFKT